MKQKWIFIGFFVLLFVGSILLYFPNTRPENEVGYDISLRRTTISIREPILPIPETVRLNPLKVVLGESLFYDTKLSRNNTISCVSCHEIKKMGTDQKQFPTGINYQLGNLNTPPVMNSSFNFKQFWDGRASSLEEQIDGPVHNPIEMGSNWEDIVQKLRQDKNYVIAFNRLYTDGIQINNIKNAITEYERSLLTPNSRFDQFLRGKKDAITEEEKKGYQLFKNFGCIACHQGVNVGGNMFQKFGIFGNFFEEREYKIRDVDMGRFNITRLEEDKFKFKVPSLRNIEVTGPYFHDGSVKTLEETVKIMIKYQLGRTSTKEEISLIVKFLKTLTGKYEKYPN